MENYFILAVLLCLSALFSGLTLGLIGLNLTELERKMNLGDKDAKKVYSVRKMGSLLLCSLLLGNTAVNSAISVYMSSITTGVIAGGLSTILIVLFGEITPQALFSRKALKYGAKMVWLVKVVMLIMWPLAKPISMLIDWLFGKELPTTWDKKEIVEIIKSHEEEEIVDKDESRIILGALSFSDKCAQDTMTPKTVLYMLEMNTVIDEALLLLIRDEGFSRIPIYNEKRDNIVGTLYSKKLIGSGHVGRTVYDLCSKDVFIYRHDTKLDHILNNLIKSKQHMSYIFDEFGTLKGVVTLEDIIEEILKTEIMDESDDVSCMREFAKEQVKDRLGID